MFVRSQSLISAILGATTCLQQVVCMGFMKTEPSTTGREKGDETSQLPCCATRGISKDMHETIKAYGLSCYILMYYTNTSPGSDTGLFGISRAKDDLNAASTAVIILTCWISLRMTTLRLACPVSVGKFLLGNLHFGKSHDGAMCKLVWLAMSYNKGWIPARCCR